MYHRVQLNDHLKLNTIFPICAAFPSGTRDKCIYETYSISNYAIYFQPTYMYVYAFHLTILFYYAAAAPLKERKNFFRAFFFRTDQNSNLECSSIEYKFFSSLAIHMQIYSTHNLLVT